jgi:Tol biopolymer transport system component
MAKKNSKSLSIGFAIALAILLSQCTPSFTQQFPKVINFQPVWSPDGDRILFIASEKNSSNLDIYQIKADGAKLIRLTDHPARDSDPVWLPKSYQIWFQSNRTDDIDGDELYSMNWDGSNLTEIRFPEFRGSVVYDLAGSRNGQKLAFSVMGDVYVMNLETRQRTRILRSVDDNETYGYSSPVWSPDGQRLALKSDEAGKEGLIVINSDGTGRVQISKNPEAYGASWSPDSQKILYTTSHWVGNGKTGNQINPTLWIASANGSSSQQRLASGTGGIWSPVDQRIIFNCPASQNFDEVGNVCLINADSTNLVKLDLQGMSFAWSPDGQKIALFIGKPESYHLSVMNWDGSKLKKLTR